MNDKQLTIWFDGREALPVRAIPYVTGWKLLSPDVVVKSFAHGKDWGYARCANLTAYHLHRNEPVVVNRCEWIDVVAKLNGFESKLNQQHPVPEESYAAWRSDVVATIIPAGVFVWLDEFEKEYQAECRREERIFMQFVDAKLILTPMAADTDTRAMVMAGFDEFQNVAGHKPDDNDKTLNTEDVIINVEECVAWYDASLDAAMWWGLKSVTPPKAAKLMCQFNPLDEKSDPTTIASDETAPEDFNRLLEVFEDEEKNDAKVRTLSQWRDIARDKKLKYHSWIDRYSQTLKLLEPVAPAAMVVTVADIRPAAKKRRKDALAVLLDEILSQTPTMTASSMMAELRKRTQADDSNSCIVDSVDGGIRWERDSGAIVELNIGALKERICNWKKKEKEG